MQVLEYQPGNGCRYTVVFTPIVSPTIAGRWGLAADAPTLVSIKASTSGSACALFAGEGGGFLSPRYVQEKLRGLTDEEAELLAEVLGYMLGRAFKPILSAPDEESPARV